MHNFNLCTFNLWVFHDRLWHTTRMEIRRKSFLTRFLNNFEFLEVVAVKVSLHESFPIPRTTHHPLHIENHHYSHHRHGKRLTAQQSCLELMRKNLIHFDMVLIHWKIIYSPDKTLERALVLTMTCNMWNEMLRIKIITHLGVEERISLQIKKFLLDESESWDFVGCSVQFWWRIIIWKIQSCNKFPVAYSKFV